VDTIEVLFLATQDEVIHFTVLSKKNNMKASGKQQGA
jgi:hypothetical protein